MSTDPARRRRPEAHDGIYLVGLTGGLASGKSTVAAVLAGSGARLVEADRLGHAVLDDPAARAELVEAFGPGILDANGAIDRGALGRAAFADGETLARLNAISHPRLLARARQALAAIAAEGFRGVVVFEAALLAEWNIGDWFDAVIVVVAPLEQRIARAARSLGISEDAAAARIARQMPDEERVRYAHRVLHNDGTRDELERRARELADALWAAWKAREDNAPRGR